MDKPIRIISMPVDSGGCGWYRVRQPLDHVKRLTPHDTHVVDLADDNMNEVSQALRVADVVIVRQGGEEGMRDIKKIPEFKHLKWVLDIDDNIDAISPYSQHYKEYGTEEFSHNGIPVWQDGQQDFNLEANRARVASLKFGMQEADLVTVTTKRLQKYASQYNDNVEIVPNYVDGSKWWKLPLKPNQPLRVGWSGGVSHYEDWYEIKEPLNQLMREYQFKLISIGAHFAGIIDEDNKHLVEVWPWVPFEAHSYRMMCMNLDIAVIPLANLPFNHYKSSIKLYEFSAMGVPSVVSNVPPYSDDISDGHNCASFKTPQEFYNKLKWLLENQEVRESIGGNALKWVRDLHEAKVVTPQIARVYERLARRT